MFENNKAYLSINEELYSLSDLDTVVDGGYLNAYNKAYDFTVKLNKLPVVAGVDLTDADDIMNWKRPTTKCRITRRALLQRIP